MRQRFTRQFKRLAVVATVLGAAVFVAAAPAEAAPTGCVSGYNGSRIGYLFCSGGTGTYRASVKCDNWPWFDYQVWGPWRSPGGTSEAICDSGDTAYGLTLEIFSPR